MERQDNKPAFVKRDAIVSGKEYAKLLSGLKERFHRSQIKAAVKVNTAILEFYRAMGHDISQLHKAAKWGSAFFDCLSLGLKAEFPNHTGFSVTNIKYAKRWYEFYNQADAIRHQVGDELDMPADFGLVPWKHHVYIFTHSKSVADLRRIIDTYTDEETSGE